MADRACYKNGNTRTDWPQGDQRPRDTRLRYDRAPPRQDYRRPQRYDDRPPRPLRDDRDRDPDRRPHHQYPRERERSNDQRDHRDRDENRSSNRGKGGQRR